MHGRDFHGEDEREGEGHEEDVGKDVADFVGEEPDVADNTAMVSFQIIGMGPRRCDGIPVAGIRIDLPVEFEWVALNEYCNNGCGEC